MKLLHDIENSLNINYDASHLETIQNPLFDIYEISLKIKRDDLIHPVISGNKWRKLKYQLVDALESRTSHLISMGGAYSNHLHALAYIGHQLNLKTTAFIRGEYDPENQTIQDLEKWGMHCIFVSRETYRSYRGLMASDDLQHQYKNSYWLKEGGFSRKAISGVQEILTEIDEPFDKFAVACGTALTLTGIVLGLKERQQALGFTSFKNKRAFPRYLRHQLDKKPEQYEFIFEYRFGGFGKFDQTLLRFQDDFFKQTKIQLDKVYTTKLMYGLLDLVSKDYFKPGTRIIALHTGGTQGNRVTYNYTTN